MLDLISIRACSHAKCQAHGLPVNEHLPLLDRPVVFRETSAITERALVLNVIVSCAYGLSRTIGREWLAQYCPPQSVSPGEWLFLQAERADVMSLRAQVQCLFAFAWALGLTGEMDAQTAMPGNLVWLYPDLNQRESPLRFVSATRLRPRAELIAALDLHYCLHWALREQVRAVDRIHAATVRERRRALEWIMGEENWDDVSLDT